MTLGVRVGDLGYLCLISGLGQDRYNLCLELFVKLPEAVRISL